MISTRNTQYQIETPAERCSWIILFFLALLSSLIGDLFILVASVGRNALKLNQFLVVVIQHIAICDLLRSLVFLLPTMVSLIANGWVFGETLAYLIFFFNLVTFEANNLLLCILTTTKVLLLKSPDRTRYWCVGGIHVACVFVWMSSFVHPVLSLVDNQGIFFDYSVYHIFNEISSFWMFIVLKVVVVIAMLIPILMVIMATTVTSCYLFKSRNAAKRSGGRIRWHGIVTVTATAIVYCCSIVPLAAFFVLFLLDINFKSIALRRISEFLTTLNIVSNFYIYYVTIPSFRNFVKSKATTSVSTTLSYLSTLRRMRNDDSTAL